MSGNIRLLATWELNQVHLPREGTPADAVNFFADQDPARLGILIVNDTLNDFIARSENSIDYQGWFWRSVDFFTPGGVTIAKGDGRVAICQNNKWDYDERDLTEDEQAKFLELVWAAYQASRKGGLVSDIQDETERLLSEANAFIAALSIEENN